VPPKSTSSAPPVILTEECSVWWSDKFEVKSGKKP